MSEMVVKKFELQMDHVEGGLIQASSTIESIIQKETDLQMETSQSSQLTKQLWNQLQKLQAEKADTDHKCRDLQLEADYLKGMVQNVLTEIRVNEQVRQMENMGGRNVLRSRAHNPYA